MIADIEHRLSASESSGTNMENGKGMCYTNSDMSFTFQIVLRPEPEGGYTVFVPTLPGCITYGESIEEAHAMAEEAITLYLEDMKERGEEIVDDMKTMDARVQVALA